ncbi:MAG: hypothetical protein HY592_00420 [Candidatus Omnitrophica bacterium]|nr:hypothetical protein [Candidatus Omnitrophota bacterium]
MKTNLEKKGAAQAAFLSSMIGILTLSAVNLGTEISEAFKETVFNIGKLWMPGAEGIGPYSGKETLSLLAWLISWFILHRMLRSKEWNQPAVLMVFLLGIGVATTLLWPPVTHLFLR